MPGIGAVEAELDPVLSVGYQLSAGLDFTYGFEVLVSSATLIFERYDLQ